jgi:hypothetical protein
MFRRLAIRRVAVDKNFRKKDSGEPNGTTCAVDLVRKAGGQEARQRSNEKPREAFSHRILM